MHSRIRPYGRGIYKKGRYYAEREEMTDGCWQQKQVSSTVVCNDRGSPPEKTCIFHPGAAFRAFCETDFCMHVQRFNYTVD